MIRAVPAIESEDDYCSPYLSKPDWGRNYHHPPGELHIRNGLGYAPVAIIKTMMYRHKPKMGYRRF